MNTPDTHIPLFAEKHYPETLQGDDLDYYLSLGWYRMGQSIFTTHFLCFGQKFYSALWIRLDLSKHTYRKGQRKMIRQNAQRFTIKYAPFQLTAEKEQLYWRYKKKFKGYLAGSLEESLMDGEELNVFKTHEVQIYDGEKLIGLSFFDLGKNSASSIMGIYDPQYHQHSLGYYTMLLEMDYCIAEGITYYYPGYVVPGYDRFDYKTRIGDVDIYQLHNGEWEPFNYTDKYVTPVQEMEAKLQVFKEGLDGSGITSHFYHYPLFEANLFGFWNTQYLDFPIFLHLDIEREGLDFFYFIVFDSRQSSYQLLRCSDIENHSFFFNKSYLNTFSPDKYFMTLSSVEATLFSSPSVKEMLEFVLEKRVLFI